MRHAADITKIKILAGESVDKTQLEGTVIYVSASEALERITAFLNTL